MTHHIFWVPWLQLSTIRYDYEYNMIRWSYLIIIITYSSATECTIMVPFRSAGTSQPYIITSQPITFEIFNCHSHASTDCQWGNQSIATAGIQHVPLTTSHASCVAMNICGCCSAQWAQFLILPIHSFCRLIHMVLWTSVCICHAFNALIYSVMLKIIVKIRK